MLKCDRCKKRAETGNPFTKEGWAASSVGDLCQQCFAELECLRRRVQKFESIQMNVFWHLNENRQDTTAS